MDTTIFTNVLFSTLSIFLIFLMVGFTVLIIYIVLILNMIKKESKKIAQDVEGVREKIKNGQAMLTHSILYVLSFFRKSK